MGMKQSTRVNLHCHSVFSDGELTPLSLADGLAKAEVEFAALTDHDSLEGLPAFHSALKRHNIGFVAGVEITAEHQEKEIHLLAYGFDIHHPELVAALRFLRHARQATIQGPLRRMPSQFPSDQESAPPKGSTPAGRIEADEAIKLVHRAGGKVFLAHPLIYATETESLSRLFDELQRIGIDGVEIPCDPDTKEARTVIDLAQHRHLTLCAGTDFHGNGKAEKTVTGVDLPNDLWKNFVHLLISAPFPEHSPSPSTAGRQEPGSSLWSLLRPGLFLPSLLAIIFFVVTVWGMILPSVEGLLVDRKRDMIRELTNAATSLLTAARRDEEAGLLTGDQARKKAMTDVAALRYGKEGKDYFWIQDMQPRIIMHPYRPDLNGSDVADFADSRGIHIFSEFTRLVRKRGNGFVGYVWQWKDDPARLVAKESYVSGFAPWGWIIGTGMYLDDVQEEIGRIERNLVYSLVAITLLILFLMLFNVRENLRIEKRRLDVQAGLQEAKARYRALIEATTEGTLLVQKGRCRYGNPTLLRITGYNSERLELLKLSDLLPEVPENADILRHLEQMPSDTEDSINFDAVLVIANGEKRTCHITINQITLAEHTGIILLVKEVLPEREAADSIRRLGLAAQGATIGILRARAVRPSHVITMNDAARQFMLGENHTEEESYALAKFFAEDSEYSGFRETLRRTGSVAEHLFQRVTVSGEIRTLSLSASLVCDDGREPSWIDCVIRDVTDSQHQQKDCEARIEALQSSLALSLQQLIQGEASASDEAMRLEQYDSHALAREIAHAIGPDEVCRQCERLLSKVRMMVDAGVRPRTIAHIASAVCDAATTRFIELAIEELGQPPAPFAFIAMGSQGRQEQTLVTDQDNAIIYEDLEGLASEETKNYFLALGARVCLWLDRAGYPFCNGKVMASNPDWCKSLADWKAHFAAWIAKADAKDLLDFSICFDFRPVYGAASLALELRTLTDRALNEWPDFLPLLARNTLLFKPPVRLLGKIIKSGGPPEEAGQLNLKEAMMPLVGFARLYALRYRIKHTHTMERIEAMVKKNVFTHDDYTAVAAVYDVLMRLRLQTQLGEFAAKRTLSNCIAIAELRAMDEAMIKEAFNRIEALQKKITHDFLEGGC